MRDMNSLLDQSDTLFQRGRYYSNEERERVIIGLETRGKIKGIYIGGSSPKGDTLLH
jgi:hypothetical protein